MKYRELPDFPEPNFEDKNIYDIYVSECAPIDEETTWRLYETNKGRGFSIDKARAKVKELGEMAKKLGVTGFTYTQRRRVFEEIVPQEPDYAAMYEEPLIGTILPTIRPEEPELSLDELADIEQWQDTIWDDHPF